MIVFSKLRYALLTLPIVLLLNCDSGNHQNTVNAFFKQSDTMTAYRLVPNPEFYYFPGGKDHPTTMMRTSDRFFHGQQIEDTFTVHDFSPYEQLIDGLTQTGGTVTFSPRFGLRLSHAQATLDLLFSENDRNVLVWDGVGYFWLTRQSPIPRPITVP